MKTIYLVLSAFILITSCSCNNSGQQPIAEIFRASAKSKETAVKKATVKITSNGELVT